MKQQKRKRRKGSASYLRPSRRERIIRVIEQQNDIRDLRQWLLDHANFHPSRIAAKLDVTLKRVYQLIPWCGLRLTSRIIPEDDFEPDMAPQPGYYARDKSRPRRRADQTIDEARKAWERMASLLD